METKTRKATPSDGKGVYWHPVNGWVIDEPNVTTPIPKPADDAIAFKVQRGD